MIAATCFTNLDDFRLAQFPRLFVAIPRVGDKVADSKGRLLTVVRITHKSDYQEFEEPYIAIELSR